jgi:hypothetical protein
MRRRRRWRRGPAARPSRRGLPRRRRVAASPSPPRVRVLPQWRGGGGRGESGRGRGRWERGERGWDGGERGFVDF